jgi:WD40 repeat protein
MPLFPYIAALYPPPPGSGRELRHSGGVVSVAFAPDGKRVASSSFEPALKIWDANSGCLLHTLTELQEDDDDAQSSIHSISFHPRADSMLYVTPDSWVQVRGTRSWKKLFAIKRIKRAPYVGEAVFSPDGSIIALGMLGGSFCFWDYWGRAPLRFADVGAHPKTISFSPDGVTVAVATIESSLCLIDVQTAECHTLLKARECGIGAAVFSPDGRWLVSNDPQGAILVWSTESWTIIKALRAEDVGSISSLALSPDSHSAAVGDNLGHIHVWDLEKSVKIAGLLGHRPSNLPDNVSCPVMSLSYSPDAQMLASGGADGTVRIWETTSYGQVV